LQNIDEIETDVDRMLAEWRSVEEGGKNLKDACQKLLEERVGSIALIFFFADLLNKYEVRINC
jgi:hypothetical protein